MAESLLPPEYTDPNTRVRLRLSTYLHGGGVGDAGLQITAVDDHIERAVCLRMPGGLAQEWLIDALIGLRAARRQAADEPWGPDESEVT